MSRNFGVLLVLIGALVAPGANAQVLLTASATRQLADALDEPKKDSLKCKIERWPTMLDFAFSFESGYLANCRLGIFDGKKATVLSFARITPQGKEPVMLGERHQIPEMPIDAFPGQDPSKLKTEVTLSGAFGVGEGDYLVEILLVDNLDRTCRKRWKMHVAANGSQRSVPISIKPLTVEPLVKPASDITKTQRSSGIRLTILLDAAPLNPYRAQLRAWDQMFLFESLYSLLRQMPYRQVRVIAFNLDQQRQIFRRDEFDGTAFPDLAHSLHDLETGTVSVQALKNRESPAFLIELLSKEMAASEPSEAIIFLGPNSRVLFKNTSRMLPLKTSSGPALFYFEYFPWIGATFDDGIAQVVKGMSGKVYPMHSPADLSQSIHKMLAQLKQE